jgi:hypothetical protein
MVATRRLIVLLVTMLCVGCSRGCDDQRAGTTQPATATTAASTQPTTRRVVFTGRSPFEGIIRSTHRQGGVPVAHVTYTIARRQIRREQIDAAAIVMSKVTGETDYQGLIVDLDKRQVVIYAKYLSEKLAITLSLDEFDREVTNSTGHALYAGKDYEFLKGGPDKYTFANTPDAVTIDGLACDRLLIQPRDMIVDHCRAIVVDRELLSRVEPHLPTEVTGFPLRVEIGTVRRDVGTVASAAHGAMPRTAELVDRALRATTRAATRAAGYIDESIEFTEISEGAVSASSLDLPPGFKMVTDHGEFTRKTTPSGVGGFDD